MKILWGLNVVIEEAGKLMGHKAVAQVSWVTHLSFLIREQTELIICYPTYETKEVVCKVGENIKFYAIPRKSKNGFSYEKELTTHYEYILEQEKPDVIHIWGTEFPSTWNLMQAAQRKSLQKQTVISIQGLLHQYVKHFQASIPWGVLYGFTFKDFIKQSNVNQYKKKLEKRAKYESLSLKKVQHVIGRTDWDRASVLAVNENAQYHYNSETMRLSFYEKRWTHESCEKHRIFISQGGIPYKGLHYALEAMAEILKFYPDAQLYVTGRNLKKGLTFKEQLRLGTYEKYVQSLMTQYGLEEHIHFLGTLSEQEMCEQYLKANVFVLPSAIENSPNSLGEAMLIGTPVVAADVGGVKNLLTHEKEGYIYQHDAPYMLAYYVMKIFAEDKKSLLEKSAYGKEHAEKLYDPQKNSEDLLEIYRKIIVEQNE